MLGPVITLIIFDPRKPSLKTDLAIIGTLQIAALIYGSYVMFDARPVYNVFVKDRFDTVAANALDPDSLARAAEEFRVLPLTGPRVVAAQPPRDAKERSKILFEATAGGHDVPELPHLYTSYADAAMSAAQSAKPLVGLSRQGEDASRIVSDFVTTHGNGARSLGYLPVKARNQDFTAVVDKKTGEIVGYLPLQPW